MSDLYIFDPYDNLLTILSNEADEAMVFWGAPFKEMVNKGAEFSVNVAADHPDSQYIITENQIAFRDKDGDFRLFVIRETEETEDKNGPSILAICLPAMMELKDELITDKRPQDVTAEVALDDALEGSRWKRGTVASLGLNSTNFYYIYATEAITKIVNTWGGEFKDWIEVGETGITGRYIDILTRRGADTGKRWEKDKDIVKMSRTTLSYPKTALYGRGSSIESGDGFSRKITFADVEWIGPEDGGTDPVTKPLGQEWVGDPEALEIFGRLNEDGTLRHRMGKFEDSQEKDTAILLQKTWDDLQKKKKQIENFELDVVLLGEMVGYEHEKVRLGDTSIALNRNFAKPIEVETRVISFEYDVADPDDSGVVELGQFIPLFSDDDRLDRIESDLDDISGKVESGSGPVTDTDFPDTVPPVPENFRANGLFKIIQVLWDYDPSSYIASYEVYASQLQDFIPEPSNLLWRGKAGAYNHNANENEQWYFRIRAVNTHDTASDYSDEIMAQTIKINAETDISPQTITNELIAENAEIDFAKIANVIVTSGMIQVEYLSSITANLGTINAGEIYGVYINGAEFVSIYEASSGVYGSMRLVDDGMTFKQGFADDFDDENPVYNDYERTTEYKSWGVSYYHEQKSIGHREYSLNDRGLSWEGVGGNNTGSFDIFVGPTSTEIGTHNGNGENFNIRSSGSILLNGEVWDNRWVDTNPAYTWDGDGTPRSFGGSLQSAFEGNANNGPGWRGAYGKVHWFGSYGTDQDGAGLQLWVPYRADADGTEYSTDGPLSYRSGRYSNLGWTAWRDFVTTTTDGTIDRVLKFDGVHYPQTNVIDHNGAGAHMYMRPQSTGELRATAVGTTTTYVPVRASSFPTSSLEEYKQDIELFEESALSIIVESELYKYRLKNEVETEENGGNPSLYHYGLVIGEGRNTPQQVINGDGVEQYAMNTLSWRAIQELDTKDKEQDNIIQDLMYRLEQVENRLEESA